MSNQTYTPDNKAPDQFDYQKNHDLNCVCMGLGVVGRDFAESRVWVCDCDAGPDHPTAMAHAVTCDCVPCPFGELS
jgi:hypothetical protein